MTASLSVCSERSLTVGYGNETCHFMEELVW